MNKSKFFKQLTPGTVVRCIEFYGDEVTEGSRMYGERTVELVNSTGVKFNTGSWLRRDDVNASDVTEVFTGAADPAVSVGWAVYQIKKSQ